MSNLLSTFIIAFRNLSRNKVRTFLTLFAIVVGVFLMLFDIGFSFGFNQNIVDASVNANAGYVVLQNPKYLKYPGVKYYVQDVSKRIKGIKKIAGVSDVQPLTFSSATIQSSYNTLAVGIKAVDPVTDIRLKSIESKNVVKGRYLKNDGSSSIVIGDKMAKRLQIDIGNKVVLLLNSSKGVLNQNLYNVVGLIHTKSSGIDQSTVLMTTTQAAKLLQMPPDSVTRLGVILTNSDMMQPIYRTIKSMNKDTGVYTWDQVLQSIASFIQIRNVINYAILFFFGLIVLGLIYNTVAMSITERRMEYLMMISIGTPLWFIRVQLFIEVLFLLIVGVFAGAFVGWLIVELINNTGGINIKVILKNFSINGSSINPQVDWIVSKTSYMWVIISMIVATMILTFIPIFRATSVKLDDRN